MNVKIINLTPHAVGVINASGGVDTIESNGHVARCAETTEFIGHLCGYKVVMRSYGEVEGLPEFTPGTFYVVSTIVRLACPNRTDLLSPGDLIRDNEDRVVACATFVANGVF